jgi:hypothetical protein
MRSLLFLIAMNLFAYPVFSQYVYTITADSVKLTSCDSSELIIMNHTQNVPGFLFNTGNGRTVFRRGAQKLGDSAYLIGADTVKVSSNAWTQGGNTFGTTGVLGTMDNNPLDLYTNSIDQVRLATSGDLLVGSTVDSSYKLDVKGTGRFGSYSAMSMIRGSLNFDNSVYASYICEGNSLSRSLQIPGTGGESPWIFNNASNEGIEIVDASGTIFLQGGKVNITSTNFSNVGSIISTEPSAYMNRTINFGSAAANHANENGTNINIVAGVGGYLPLGYSGGNVMINPGAGGPRGANGDILLGNTVDGNVGIQTSSPVSNFEVDQGTAGPGTVSNAAAGTTVSGAGTQFTNTFKIGDSISIAGQKVAILAILSDIDMTTTTIASSDSNATYTLTGGSRFHVKGNGYVGVGTSAPTAQLHTTGSVRFAGLTSDSTQTNVIVSDPSGNLYLRSASSLAANDIIRSSLAVNGPISAQRLMLSRQDWADYVFDSSYRLPSLAATEDYIRRQHHLPGIPSAAEVKEKGVDVGDNQAALLQKVEELTLYAVDQDKRLNVQRETTAQQAKEIDIQNAKIAVLEAKIELLTKLINTKIR